MPAIQCVLCVSGGGQPLTPHSEKIHSLEEQSLSLVPHISSLHRTADLAQSPVAFTAPMQSPCSLEAAGGHSMMGSSSVGGLHRASHSQVYC